MKENILYCPTCGLAVAANNSNDTICPHCGTNITKEISK